MVKKVQIDFDDIVDFIITDIRDISVKRERCEEWNRIKDSSPLYKFMYSKCNYNMFICADIEKCPAALKVYKRYPVFKEDKLSDAFEYEMENGDKIRLTADIMTSAGWLIGEFLCSDIGKCILDKMSMSLYQEEKLCGKEKATYNAMNTFLKCIYTHGNFTIAGKNRAAGRCGCVDQWDHAMIHFLKCLENSCLLEKSLVLKNINEKPLNQRTNADGYNLMCILFKNPIKDLFYEDYKEYENRLVIDDRNSIDWENVFFEYAKLILKRGISIYCEIHNIKISEEEKNIVVKKAFAKM